MADEPSIVKEDLITIIREGSKIGLILNTGKCELFINDQDPQSVEKILDDFKEIAQDIRHIDDSTLVLLGAPILENSYDSILSAKVLEMQRLMARLRFLDCHEAFYIIKTVCISRSFFLY